MKKEVFRVGSLAKIKKQKIEGIFEQITFVFNAKSGADEWATENKPTQILNGELMDGFLKDLELFYPLCSLSDRLGRNRVYADGEFIRGLSFAETLDFANARDENHAIIVEGPIGKKPPDIYYDMFPMAKKTVVKLNLYKILLGKKLYWINDEHLEDPY